MKKFLAIFLCMALLMSGFTFLIAASAADRSVSAVVAADEGEDEGEINLWELFRLFLGLADWGQFFVKIWETLLSFINMGAMA